jgi:hypothetical protein
MATNLGCQNAGGGIKNDEGMGQKLLATENLAQKSHAGVASLSGAREARRMERQDCTGINKDRGTLGIYRIEG